MDIEILSDKKTLGTKAASRGAAAIRGAIARQGRAAIIVATGASQFEMLEALVAAPGIDWPAVTVFHLDEYVGLPITHPASFRRYLDERFVSRLPGLGRFVPVDGDAADLAGEVRRLNGLIGSQPIDVCFAGIGENCHLAFNDPPADFDTDAPYIVVTLDEACRRQQLGEGWFASLDAVPARAISMSIRQIMKSRELVVCVSDTRKAKAAAAALEGPVTPAQPAAILQRHAACTIYLDPPAAAGLRAPARA